MRVLLAGALGEVGRGLHVALTDRGHTVTAISSRAPLVENPDVVSVSRALPALAEGEFDVVVNASGPGDHRSSSRNAAATARLLLNAVADVPAVLISTTRVLEGYEEIPRESSQARPTTSYGQANAELESMWLDHPHTSVLRLVNYFGQPSTPNSPQARLLPWSLLIEGWETGSIRVRSRALSTKEFIDSSDAVTALEILAVTQPPERVAIAGPGTKLTLQELANAAVAVIGRVSGDEVATTFGDETGAATRAPHAQWLGTRGWRAGLSLERVTEQMADWLVQWAPSIPRAGLAEGR